MNNNQEFKAEVVEETVFNVPVATMTKGNIVCDFENFKKQIKERTEFCASLLLSEENEKQIKDIKAGLNNAEKQLKSYATSIKNEFLKPFEPYEKEIKECTEMIKNASDTLKAQLDERQKAMDQLKTEKIQNKWNEFKIEKGYLHDALVPLKSVFNERWKNKGYKDTDIESDLRNLMDKVTLQVQQIKALDNADYYLLDYAKDVTFENVMNESLCNSIVAKAMFQKKAIEEAKAKEAGAREVEEIVVNTVEEPKPQPKHVEPDPIVETKELAILIKYQTKAQLIELDGFLKRAGIKYNILKMKEK